MGLSMYEIDEAMLALVDDETGEILDPEAFDELAMAKEAKIENVALWYKNLTATAKAIQAEEKALRERRQAAERKATSLKNLLVRWLDGAKFETSRVACKWRGSSAVVVSDEDSLIDWAQRTPGCDDLLKYAKPEISLTKVGNYIKEHGADSIPFALIEKRSNLSIQ